jgi:predicted metal-dependent phosphoesterase TrpH
MQRVEFHCHTIYSKDSLTTPGKLVDTCRRKGIQRVVVTDHNTIDGALVAKEFDPQRVIVGEEILTQAGELLAAFLREWVPPGLTALETIERLRKQGAFISVAHPFDRSRKGHWDLPDLLEILPHVDAIETFNARSMRPLFNDQAKNFAREHQIAGTVGSDAHTPFELGKATMLLADFEDADDLRQVIGQAQYDVSWSPPWIHLTSRFAVWWKMLSGYQNPKTTAQ